MATANFPGRYDSLAEIGEFVKQAAKNASLDDSATYAVQLAVDEACSNIIEHAYGGEEKGIIRCTCTISPKALTIVLRDRGRPFNPESVPVPEPNAKLEDLKPGGAGLYLIRKLMDEVYFEFHPDRGNCLTLIKRRDKGLL